MRTDGVIEEGVKNEKEKPSPDYFSLAFCAILFLHFG